MSNNRISALDNLKFFLILLVVYGHLKSVCTIIPYSANIIYSFHMPLFMFISGFLSKRVDNDKFANNTKRLFKVFLIFQFIHIAPSLLTGHFHFSWFIIPEWTLWYVFVLILYRAIIQLNLNWNYTYVFLLILLSLIVSFIPINSQLAFQRFFTFAPYFFLGFILKNKYSFYEIQDKLNNKLLIFVSISLSLFLLIIIPFEYYWGDYSYYDWDRPLFKSVIYKSLTYVCAFCMSIPIIKCTPTKTFSISSTDTLFIYMYHSILIIPCLALIIRKFNLPTEWYYSPIFYMSLVYILFLMYKSRLLRQLVK